MLPVGYDGITLPEIYLEADIEYETPYTKVVKFEQDIDVEVEKLGKNHSFYGDADGIYYRGYLIRKKPFSPSIIFYFVDGKAETVYVIRILRHEVNWQKLLRETTVYTFD